MRARNVPLAARDPAEPCGGLARVTRCGRRGIGQARGAMRRLRESLVNQPT